MQGLLSGPVGGGGGGATAWPRPLPGPALTEPRWEPGAMWSSSAVPSGGWVLHGDLQIAATNLGVLDTDWFPAGPSVAQKPWRRAGASTRASAFAGSILTPENVPGWWVPSPAGGQLVPEACLL